MNLIGPELQRSMQQRALLRWETQRNIPLSPGAFDRSGNYQLCLGATLAEAATWALEGEVAARNFVEHLCQTPTKLFIVDQFVRLGWPAEFAWEKIARNDATAETFRRNALRAEVERFSDNGRSDA
jgi:hypothetical protein